MIAYNYDADLEVSDTCVRSSLLSWVELYWKQFDLYSRFDTWRVTGHRAKPSYA